MLKINIPGAVVVVDVALVVIIVKLLEILV